RDDKDPAARSEPGHRDLHHVTLWSPRYKIATPSDTLVHEIGRKTADDGESCTRRAQRQFRYSGRPAARRQYVDRPPLRSQTAPVENEFSSEASHATSDASSCTSRKRPLGIFESMYWMCASDICSKIRVRAAAGVTQFTAMFADASSLPSDFVS